MKIAVFTQELGGGAFGNVALTLAKALMKCGVSQVDLLHLRGKNTRGDAGCRYVSLGAVRMALVMPSLVVYLRKQNPDIMIAMPVYVNIIAVIAKLLSRWKGKLVVTENAVMSQKMVEHKGELVMGNIHMLAKFTYPFADAITSVSKGVMGDLYSVLNIDDKLTAVIPNAVDIDFVRHLGGCPRIRIFENQDF